MEEVKRQIKSVKMNGIFNPDTYVPVLRNTGMKVSQSWKSITTDHLST